MTKEMRENRDKYCLNCVQNRARPFCSKEEMLPGCPWLDAEEQEEEIDEWAWEADEGIIYCACCGKEKYIPRKSLWTYKKEYKHPGNVSSFDYYCSYTCWRKEEKYLEELQKEGLANCA